jgi:hypothetical protein
MILEILPASDEPTADVSFWDIMAAGADSVGDTGQAEANIGEFEINDFNAIAGLSPAAKARQVSQTAQGAARSARLSARPAR